MTEQRAKDYLEHMLNMMAKEPPENLTDERDIKEWEDEHNSIRETLKVSLVAVEKQIPKKPITKEMPYSEDIGFNDEYYCPTCGSFVGYGAEGMNEPEQMKYCNECGQHIARDWSE